MRTIEEIKESIAVDFMNNDTIAEMYGFTVGDNFSEHFSKVSLMNILFHIFAASAWVMENIFDTHKKEVQEQLENLIPHRARWYRDKMLQFMKGHVLITDTDRYDTSGMTDAEIQQARVVKHAVAVENEDYSILTIKVAGEQRGMAAGRGPLDEETVEQLEAYLAEVKDAGVRINLVNLSPDTFNCEIDIYYDPLLLPETVENNCQEAISNYISNLPFNGEYTNMALIDTLQLIEGVRVAELKSSSYAPSETGLYLPINARCTPEAGYFGVGHVQLNLMVYG
ncbi:MAG: hypothetical protein LUF04_07170 [Bacteroides sp.]|nr:hypothetical protein [Bacteroides sp.]